VTVLQTSSVDDYVQGDLQRLTVKDTFFLFFISTTGEGEHTDTIRQTWSLLYVLLRVLLKNRWHIISVIV
jgi:hypothetical protein